MKKLFAYILISILWLFSLSANAADEAFITDSFTLAAEDYSSTAGVVSFSGCEAKPLTETEEIHLSDEGLLGKIYSKFKIVGLNGIGGTEVCLDAIDYKNNCANIELVNLHFDEENDNHSYYTVYINDEIIGDFYYGQCVEWEIKLDLSGETVCVIGKTDTECLTKTIAIKSDCLLKSMKILPSSTGFYINSYSVEKTETVYGNEPVIFKEGNFYCAVVSTQNPSLRDGNLYFAAFGSNTSLLKCEVKPLMVDCEDIYFEKDQDMVVLTGQGTPGSLLTMTITDSNEGLIHVDQCTVGSNGTYRFTGFRPYEDGTYNLTLFDRSMRNKYNLVAIFENGDAGVRGSISNKQVMLFIHKDDVVDFAELKAFVWTNELSPQTAYAHALAANVPVAETDVLDITMTVADGYLHTNSAIDFSVVTDEVGQTFKLEIFDESDNCVFSEVSDDNEWTYVPVTKGKYTTELTLIENGLMIPVSKEDIYVSSTKQDEDTFVFVSGKTYYRRNEVEYSFLDNDCAYAPLFADGELYLSENELFHVADVISNDKFEQYGVVSTVNTVRNANNGSNTVYCLSDILSGLGYYSSYHKGVLVVSKNIAYSSDNRTSTSDLIVGENFDDGSIDSFSHSVGTAATAGFGIGYNEYYDGGASYYLDYPGTSVADGYHFSSDYTAYNHILRSPEIYCNENEYDYNLRFVAKRTAGEYPGVLKLQLWKYNGTKWTTKLYDITQPSTEWGIYEVTIPASDLIGCSKFEIRFIVEGKLYNSGLFNYVNSSGRLFIDNVRINKIYEVPACYNELEEIAKSEETDVLDVSFSDTAISELICRDRTSSGTVAAAKNVSIVELEGNKVLRVAAISDGWTSVELPYIEIDPTVATYTIRLRVKTSDYLYNMPRVSLFLYKDSTFKKFSNIKTLYDVVEDGEWINIECKLSASSFMYVDCNRFRISLDTQNVSGGTSSGYVYFDDVRVVKEAFVGEPIVMNMESENYASWYVLENNDKVTYKPDGVDDGISLLRGYVFDSDDNIVDTVVVSKYIAENEGWSWSPTEPGYYEVEFEAVMVDGAVRPVSAYYSYNTGDFYLNRRQFAVVTNAPAELEDRDPRLYFSITYDSETSTLAEDYFKVADLVGFKGPRWIHINWDEIETVQGTYDWSETDEFFDLLEQSGYVDAMVCVMGTPRWASPSTDSSYTGSGMKKYHCYAPKDEFEDEYKAFLTALINRYGEKISFIEVGNEAYIRDYATAFWNDTAENYVKMLTWAYDAIKAVDSSIMVSTAGTYSLDDFNAYYEADSNFINKFDYFGIHGQYGTSTPIINRMKELNIEPKWASTESYYSAYHSADDIPADRRAQALFFLVNLMSETKYDAGRMTYYNVINYGGITEDEYSVYAYKNGLSTGERYNMFRHYPFIEPEESAVAAFNLFNVLGKGFSYLGEYTFDSTQRMVLFSKENGDRVVAVWNSEGNDFDLSQNILSEIDSSYVIKDMEGKTITHTNSLKGNKVYYISNINPNAFNSFTFDNSVLNNSYIPPYYNCITE